MRILPVIDVCDGIVVRALAGRRSEYQPLTSRLTTSTDPLEVAEVIRARHGWSEFYVADLNSITSFSPDLALAERFRAAGFRIWLDAGVRHAGDAEALAPHVAQVVVGSETLGALASLREIVFRLRSERAVFSLDLRNGRPIGDAGGQADPLTIADQVIAAGARRMIVLDLAFVGTGAGVRTNALCAELIRRYPKGEVYTGGGIHDCDDIRRLERIGVAGVLVASALHDGVLDDASANRR
jgi:phosphoribosylformimino-5-aminoimidazole carboxamide ribotide isomerase